MKIAEALSIRADCNKRIAQIKKRIIDNARIQEGEEPSENPSELLAKHSALVAELEVLIRRINRTNTATEFEPGVSLSDILAKRDALAISRNIYRELVDAATVKPDRYSRSEIKTLSCVNVKDIQQKADDLAKQYRELDLRIQSMNWEAELI